MSPTKADEYPIHYLRRLIKPPIKTSGTVLKISEKDVGSGTTEKAIPRIRDESRNSTTVATWLGISIVTKFLPPDAMP